LGALTAKGIKVQPFKKGPDYIDPSWLSVMARNTCRNLDCYLMDEETLRGSFIRASCGADIAIVEGNMGLYDGLDRDGSGSTAELAKKLQAPVILVMDCRRMTRSAAAMVMGFQHFDREVNIAGVILNHVARSRHRKMLEDCIRDYCGLPVLGVIPKNSGIGIPNRHLGLIPASENEELTRLFQTATGLIMENFDLDAIIALAKGAPALPWDGVLPAGEETSSSVTIGVVRDRVFSFYYPENLEALVQAGAKLEFIDSLRDEALPDVDALLIGGGFPEEFCQALNMNKGFMESIREKAEAGLPIYAECGGMTFLGRSICVDGVRYPMVGLLPFDGVIEEKPVGHGYTLLEVTRPNPLISLGTVVRGHEFFHTRLVNLDLHPGIELVYRVCRGHGIDGRHDGLLYKNVFASYTHLHALGTKEWAANFVALARWYQGRKTTQGDVPIYRLDFSRDFK
ncbi:MAG TPA: hydrogenobyrinic acid a,c-diamide synthase (glutamine-hydrolyzing), partial [Clostridia bacterium]|nr:hydrogenobyrinic acid a,c-diamide synthase (glutamine-hydrolyzing) [Clostridia bacterium]